MITFKRSVFSPVNWRPSPMGTKHKHDKMARCLEYNSTMALLHNRSKTTHTILRQQRLFIPQSVQWSYNHIHSTNFEQLTWFPVLRGWKDSILPRNYNFFRARCECAIHATCACSPCNWKARQNGARCTSRNSQLRFQAEWEKVDICRNMTVLVFSISTSVEVDMESVRVEYAAVVYIAVPVVVHTCANYIATVRCNLICCTLWGCAADDGELMMGSWWWGADDGELMVGSWWWGAADSGELMMGSWWWGADDGELMMGSWWWGADDGELMMGSWWWGADDGELMMGSWWWGADDGELMMGSWWWGAADGGELMMGSWWWGADGGELIVRSWWWGADGGELREIDGWELMMGSWWWGADGGELMVGSW